MYNSYFILTFFIFLNILIFILSDKFIKIFNTYDYPDKKRKFHRDKVSLFGGSIILLNCLSFYIIGILLNNSIKYDFIFLNTFIIGSISFYFLGLIDDKINLGYNKKFTIEIIIIIFLIFFNQELIINKIYLSSFDFQINLGKFSYFFTALCILIFLNAFNMFDGINLQSGIYSLIIFTYLTIISNNNLILIILIISLIPFLVLNYNSKVFLGDNGTLLLGFIISYLIIITAKETSYLVLSADKIFILMILPGLELIRLFIIRLKLKRHPFSSDRMHLHHIFLKKYGYKKTIIFIQLLALIPISLMHLFNNHIYLIIFSFTLIYIFMTLNEK